jgi:hypothetical protein
LKPDETGALGRRQRFGHRGLPDPGLAFQKYGDFQSASQVEHGGERTVRDVVLLRERLRYIAHRVLGSVQSG